MGSAYSKESNRNPELIQELARISSGSGDVMFFESGYEQTTEKTILWGIKNFVVGGYCFEHTLDAKLDESTEVSFSLRQSSGVSENVMLFCSSKTDDGESHDIEGLPLPEKRRLSVKVAIHGSHSQGKEVFQIQGVKEFENFYYVSIRKDVLFSRISSSGSLLLELTVTVFHERPAVETKLNMTSASGLSAKTRGNSRKLLDNGKTENKNDGTLLDVKKRSLWRHLPFFFRRTSSSGKIKAFQGGGNEKPNYMQKEVSPSNKWNGCKTSASVNKTIKMTHPISGEGRMSPDAFPEKLEGQGKVEEKRHDDLKQSEDTPLRDPCKITLQEFQKVMIKRVGEMRREAERKRLEFLRRILDMNSRTGINPLEIFPGEIWEEILDKLEPQDRANVRQVHPVFSVLMEGTMIQNTLFPLLMQYGIPLIQGYPPKYLGPYSGLPRFPPKEDLKQLMLLRQVSKGLRDSVDKWFNDRLLHFMRNSRPRFCCMRRSFDDSYRQVLNTADFFKTQGTTVIQHVVDYSSCRQRRFFLRSLRIKVPAQELTAEETEIWNRNVTEFLGSVGDQIWHLDLYFQIGGNLRKFSNNVREWLLLVPNLKGLVLEAPDCGYRLSRTYQPDEPIPKLNGLERLDMCGPLLFPLGDAILNANRHVKSHTREPQDYIGDTYANYYESTSTLALEAAYIGWGDMTTTVAYGSVPELQQDAYSNWNLKRMELWIQSFRSEKILMGDILQFIQKFQTLEDVQLHINEVLIGDEINFLRLPNLKNFSIVFGPKVESSGEMAFFHSLQFLFHCSRLRNIYWENRMRGDDLRPALESMRDVDHNQGIMIDFKGGNMDLGESNIWDVFPQLRSITVKFWHGGGSDEVNETFRKYLRV